ncbi:MAG: hypothetical protein IKA70_00070 [Alistipes sp.]|nr:hypothetical protein [Alistipes sp.]
MCIVKRFSVMAAALLVWAGVAAQSYNIGGAVMDHDIISTADVLSLSQRQPLGTARSMAMGGAFTSLGGDLAAIGINPAGLGMYRQNDVAITLSVGINKASTPGVIAYNKDDNTTTRFSINNLGASMKVYEGTGKILAVNLALSYNKVADYNYSTSFSMPNNAGSLADAFADMANGGGLVINPTSEGRFIGDTYGNNNYMLNPYYWGAVLGYKNGLINNKGAGWLPDEIGNGAAINQFYSLRSQGSAAEYSVAVGANYNNIVYFGASLDIQSINREQHIYYGEEIDYPGGAPSGDELEYRLNYFNYSQTTRINGSGIGAKVGVTVRPVEALRIGVAFHTPVYYSLSYRYVAQMSSRAYSAGDNSEDYTLVNGYVYGNELTPELLDNGSYRWNYITPMRVLVGVSYAFGSMAIVSVDYQYDAYTAMRFRSAPYDVNEGNAMFRSELRGTHTVRGGVEIKPHPIFALRVGGGYTDRVARSKDIIFSHSVLRDTWYCSAGVGFRLSKVVYLDLAYSYRSESHTPYYLYYSVADSGEANQSGLFKTDCTRHNVALTLGVRF